MKMVENERMKMVESNGFHGICTFFIESDDKNAIN